MTSFSYKDATSQEIERVEAWFVTTVARLVRSTCPLSDEEKTDALDKAAAVTIRIKDCRRREKRLQVKRGRNSRITICRDSLSRSIFFKGLVRLIGGNALDAEALENHCFEVDQDFDEEDWQDLVDGSVAQDGSVERTGKFVIWNPCTGEKWYNERTATNPRRGTALRANPVMPKAVRDALGIDCPPAGKKKTKKRRKKRRRY